MCHENQMVLRQRSDQGLPLWRTPIRASALQVFPTLTRNAFEYVDGFANPGRGGNAPDSGFEDHRPHKPSAVGFAEKPLPHLSSSQYSSSYLLRPMGKIRHEHSQN